jgi:hypothetical protein
MNEDWIAHFFAQSRLTSDEEMQSLWARLLAGEANAPGTYSKRTVNLVSELSKSEAELFTKLCGFAAIQASGAILFIYSFDHPIYLNNGINFAVARDLEHAGLVKADSIGYMAKIGSRPVDIGYFGHKITLHPNELKFGFVTFTTSGTELSRICGAKIVPGFIDYLKEQWKEHAPVFVTNIEAPITDSNIP